MLVLAPLIAPPSGFGQVSPSKKAGTLAKTAWGEPDLQLGSSSRGVSADSSSEKAK